VAKRRNDQKLKKNPPHSNSSRIINYKKDLYRDRQLFLKFKYENAIKKKNKPDLALV
jgi:hypothetical protein